MHFWPTGAQRRIYSAAVADVYEKGDFVVDEERSVKSLNSENVIFKEDLYVSNYYDKIYFLMKT